MSYSTNVIRVPMEDVADENDFDEMIPGESNLMLNGSPFGIYLGTDQRTGLVWVNI